jgi:hypothetical protein
VDKDFPISIPFVVVVVVALVYDKTWIDVPEVVVVVINVVTVEVVIGRDTFCSSLQLSLLLILRVSVEAHQS